MSYPYRRTTWVLRGVDGWCASFSGEIGIALRIHQLKG
jgi:hypothetical protein